LSKKKKRQPWRLSRQLIVVAEVLLILAVLAEGKGPVSLHDAMMLVKLLLQHHG